MIRSSLHRLAHSPNCIPRTKAQTTARSACIASNIASNIASHHQSRWLHLKTSQVVIEHCTSKDGVRYNSTKASSSGSDANDLQNSSSPTNRSEAEADSSISQEANDHHDFASSLKKTLEDMPLQSTRSDPESSTASPLDLDSLIMSYRNSENSPEKINTSDEQKPQPDSTIAQDNSTTAQDNSTTAQDNSTAQDKFDDLLASLDFSTGTDPATSTPTDEQIGSKERAEKFRPVDLDKSDENVHEFEDNIRGHIKRANFIREERNLLQNIFNSYITDTPKTSASNKIEKEALWSIRDSLNSTRKQFDHALSTRKTSFHNVSKELKMKLFKRTEEALKPTFVHVDDTLTKPVEQVAFLRQLLDGWFKTYGKNAKLTKDDTIKMMDEFYLNDLFDNEESVTLKPKHRKFINRVQWASEETPLSPQLNVITMPLIFNKILSNLSYKFYNGQLALSLFNLIKQDLELYTVMISQQTYNEILKTYWIYYGKSNLYGIEMLFSEMRNNGFNGDLTTINIVRQILLDYHSLKLGKVSANHSQSSTHLKVPIWTKEDDTRAANLERQLHNLAASLEKEYLGM